MMRSLFVLFATASFLGSALQAQDRATAEKIRELEGALRPLENPDVDAFVTYLSHFCLILDESTALLPLYQAAATEEKYHLAAGLGENHPKSKAIRERKELIATYLTAFRVRQRNEVAAQLEGLRK